MPLHLIKLFVGREELSELQDWQAGRIAQCSREGKTPELMHITRNTPKRGAEILADGGSIYWVMKSHIVARNRLLEFRPMKVEGVPHCALVYDTELVVVKPQPQRPFQGWRYLEAKDAPKDLRDIQGDKEVPLQLWHELKALGVL